MDILGNWTGRNKARFLFSLYVLVLLIFDTEFSFMILNLFLAFIALEVSYVMSFLLMKSKSPAPVRIVVYAVFILLSPNVFYVVTDLIHMNLFQFDYLIQLDPKEWWHFFLLSSGVIIAIFFYHLMIEQVRNIINRSKWSLLLLFTFIVLGSIGIYIGRFLRFHSVHVFTKPFSVLEHFLSSLTIDSLMFIIWITLLQLLVVWLFPSTKKE